MRRVITGEDSQGKSCVIFDGETPCLVENPNMGITARLLWETTSTPASNAGNADAADRAFPADVAPKNGTRFYTFVYAPGAGKAKTREDGTTEPGSGMHKTATIDYIVILSGEMTFLTDSGEVLLRPGDTLVDRGVAHAWENRGDEPVVMASITVDAEPLGKVDF